MTEINIKALLPQKEPFLFLDQLLSADSDEITGIKLYDEFFPYYLTYPPDQQIVPGAILIESLVQCGGAGITKLAIAGQALWGLTALDKVRLSGLVRPNSTVKMVVNNLKLSNKIIRQTGVSYCDGRVILKATWSCLRIKI